jgi:hypothetical protein
VKPGLVLQCIRKRAIDSPAGESFREFMGGSEAVAANKLANRLKHGDALAWRGFEVVLEAHVDMSSDGRHRRISLGYRPSHDLGTELRKLARVYRAFVPVAEEAIREYAAGAVRGA